MNFMGLFETVLYAVIALVAGFLLAKYIKDKMQK